MEITSAKNFKVAESNCRTIWLSRFFSLESERADGELFNLRISFSRQNESKLKFVLSQREVLEFEGEKQNFLFFSDSLK
ncbi:MAG: hypothetical protein WCI72_05520 [archaeon]